VKTSFICFILVLAFLSIAIPSSAKSPVHGDPWGVLDKITHKRDYTIETRDHKCVMGRITRVAADRLTAEIYKWNSSGLAHLDTVIFPRADVLRVISGRAVYYSGRSSWLDVSLIRAKGRERLELVTTVGRIYEVKPPYAVSDHGITLSTSGKSTEILKSEIVRVYKLTLKPFTANCEYLAQELGPMVIFDPDLYVWGLHLEGYVPVLLYNSVDPEDNSSAQCAPDSLL
jgi:hypothetical protein